MAHLGQRPVSSLAPMAHVERDRASLLPIRVSNGSTDEAEER